MSLLLKYNTFYLLAEITLKLGLQSTEEYFPYIAYAFFVFLLCKKVFYLKLMLIILKLRSFLFSLSWKIIPKDFPNASSMYMLLLQLSYISQRVE